MGVTGLWKLIEPCGDAVPLDTLESKILAVDISIWLHQVVKGFQDSKGSAVPNAHLLGLFHRLCKLLYYRVKPIFVFDGCVPQLKRDTIAHRQRQRNKLQSESERIEALLLQSLAKEKVVQQALGASASDLLQKSANTRPCATSTRNNVDEIFKLPDIPAVTTTSLHTANNDNESLCLDSSADYITTSEEDSSFDESNPRNYYNANLQAIDVRSKHFRALPADVRHEILVDIKDTRKQSSWGRLHELPAKGDDFSVFQMKRLLKRRTVQDSIEETLKEMEGCSLTYNELQNLFTEEGIIQSSSITKGSKQISSDENTRFLLVRDLKKNSASLNNETVNIITENLSDEEPCTSQQSSKLPQRSKKSGDEELDKEFAKDLELAIALSLEQPTVYNVDDYEYDSDESVKLNECQRKQLRNAAVGPARAYMIEYAGINDDGIMAIMENTESFIEEDITRNSDEYKSKIVSTSTETLLDAYKDKSENVPLTESVIICSSESDTDLEEVSDENLAEQNAKNFEIVIDPTKPLIKGDDMFADVFEKTEEPFIHNISGLEHNTKKPICKSITPNMSTIFLELNEQAKDIKNITLNDIKIDSSVLELTSNEVKEAVELKACEERLNVINNSVEKFFLTKTPNENKIDSEFRTDNVIQHTDGDLLNVNSPFVINKTQLKSNRKHFLQNVSKPPSPIEKANVKKLLFPSEKRTAENAAEKECANGIKLMNEAANLLKQAKSTEELKELSKDLLKERKDLESERNRQDRMGMSISQRMSSDCQELLRLFGIPYVVAPMEAEAQCAFLDANKLTHGTITDDSDIWLFGGRTVYKNFFAQNKHVLEFQAEKIEKLFNCDRIRLIQLACLVGSDYTTGVHGIGAVTALEILATFSSKGENPQEKEKSVLKIVSTLNRFRDWWRVGKTKNTKSSPSKSVSLRKKLRNIELHDGFPNTAVIEAYLTPKVDENKDTFTWGYPDVESIREFTRKTFGWTNSKTDGILMPVIRKINERKTQATIKNYFSVKSSLIGRHLKVSKRVKNAIEKMSEGEKDKTVKVVKSKSPIKRKSNFKGDSRQKSQKK